MHGDKIVVLLVEDDPLIRSVMPRLLERDGFQTYAAADAHEARFICARHLPEIDVLFADIILTGQIRGHELAAELKLLKPSLIVLFTSGYDADGLVPEGDLHYGVNFLAKPYSASHLRELILTAFVCSSEKLTTPALSPNLG